MKKWKIVAAAGMVVFGASPALAQGIGHKFFMRGSIVAADPKGTVVCIGRADGAKVGQTLEVYRITTVPGPSKGIFHRNLIGHVKIDHIFNDRFAHVSVADGKADVNDIVELKRS